MNVSTAVKAIMKEHGVSNSDLARKCNVSHQAMSKRLASKDISVSLLGETVELMDYRVVLIPEEETLPKGSLPISGINSRRK